MMSDENMVDWDMLDENYCESGNEVKSLEEYIVECGVDDEDAFGASLMDADRDILLKTIEDVKNVRKMISDGVTVDEISDALSLEKKYVTDIAIILNSSTEDEDDIAIAHLVLI